MIACMHTQRSGSATRGAGHGARTNDRPSLLAASAAAAASPAPLQHPPWKPWKLNAKEKKGSDSAADLQEKKGVTCACVPQPRLRARMQSAESRQVAFALHSTVSLGLEQIKAPLQPHTHETAERTSLHMARASPQLFNAYATGWSTPTMSGMPDSDRMSSPNTRSHLPYAQERNGLGFISVVRKNERHACDLGR